MDRPRPISTMESRINFCMLHHDQNSFIPEIVKQNVCEPSLSSLAFKNHKSITLEEDDDEIIDFDDESDSESKIELEIDPVAQKLLNAYPFWSDKEKKIKEIEVNKITNTKSYQKAQLSMRQVIMEELEIQLIHEWREQIGRFTPGILDYESEEEPKNLDFINKQTEDNPNSSIEKEK